MVKYQKKKGREIMKKTKVKESVEYTKESEREEGIKREFQDFFSSSKLYIKDTARLYLAFFKRLYEKISTMLCEELIALAKTCLKG
jgi:hypothetical protein